MNNCSSPVLDSYAGYIKEVFTDKSVYLCYYILLQ
jgi:hypothetical protein